MTAIDGRVGRIDLVGTAGATLDLTTTWLDGGAPANLGAGVTVWLGGPIGGLQDFTGATAIAGTVAGNVATFAVPVPTTPTTRVRLARGSTVVAVGDLVATTDGSAAPGASLTIQAGGSVSVTVAAAPATWSAPLTLSSLPTGSAPVPATDTLVGVQGGAAVQWTLATLMANVADLTASGVVQVKDSTASHGAFAVSVGTFGPFMSLLGNSGDAQPKVLFSGQGLSLGPGGATAPDFKILRDAAARAAITGALYFENANIVAGTGTGMKLGTAGTQKLGFWGATPVVQPSGWTALTGTATKGGFDTGTVTTQQLAQVVKAMLDAAITIGIFAP